MTITNLQRDAAYEAATNQQKALYEEPESGALLWKIAEKYQLTQDDTYRTFVIGVGDVILGLEKQTNLPGLLTEKLGLDFSQAIKLTADIIDFLNTPVTREPTDLASDIAETEAALEAIPKNLPVTSAADQPDEQTGSANIPSIPTPQPPEAQPEETYRVPPSAPPTLAKNYQAAKNASLRTMAEDMRAAHAQEPTYTSTQSAILKESRPNQTAKEPRWGEE